MSCDCGDSAIGKWTGRVGGQIGDKIDYLGRSAVASGLKRFKNWTGLGDYQINTNSLISDGQVMDVRIMTEGRGIRVSFKEYLGEVRTGSSVGVFHAQTFAVNPGLVTTFPWLGPIAAQYDQWKPNGILFEFVSTATDYSATNASLGSVIMASEYDVADDVFKDKQTMLNSAYSQEAKMSANAVHGIECEPAETSRKLFYTRTLATDTTGQDLRDYDLCNFTIATQGGGLAVNSSVGSLYVHYDIIFYKEQLVGGIVNKNMLSTTWVRDIEDGITGSRMGTPTPRGSDMGIIVGETATAGTWIQFPANLAGGYFEIEMRLFCDDPVIQKQWATFNEQDLVRGMSRAPTPAENSQLVAYHDFNWDLDFPAPAVTNVNIWMEETRGTSFPEKVTRCWTVVKLDDQIYTEYADIQIKFGKQSWLAQGGAPGLPGAKQITVVITCVNDKYMDKI